MSKPKKVRTSETRLGRGLSALFDQDKASELLEETSEVLWVNLSQIRPATKQARKYFDDEKLAELAASLKSYGVIEPVIVERKENFWSIIAGERRFRAAKIAGLKKIPVLVRSGSGGENHSTEVMLAENLQRENLTAIEEAEAFLDIINNRSLTQQDLAKIIGKSRSYVANTLRLLKLPQEVQVKISKGVISPSVARSLVNLSAEEQKKMVKKISDVGLSARDVERHTRKISKKSSGSSSKKDIDLVDFEKFFRQELRTKVTLKPIKKGVGKLELEYYSYDDLSDLLDRLKKAQKN